MAPPPPECCLVNLYRAGAKMGLHQDRDEKDVSAAVIGVSLGDEALFRIGGSRRQWAGGKTVSVILASGDVIAFGGAGPAGLSRHRPHPAGNLAAAAGRRPAQPDPAARVGYADVAGSIKKGPRPGGRGQMRFNSARGSREGMTGNPSEDGS